ncbi:MAG: ABC transporter ATP-binding protein [Acidobacteria bacterium]|nr:MAG: ABC transporter ATP-binding protein [Acidobacteriota bacterium]
MPEAVIVTEKLSRNFGGVRAVQNLSLEIPPGSIFGLLGPNGSGKTTTVRLLLGLLQPSSGCARVLGFDTRTDADRVRQASGVLLEHDGLYERLTAEDNLDFYGRLWRLSDRERRKRTQELLTDIGLWERRREKIATWSKGMKQKLAVARALFHRPRVVFLDEPTAGLDPIAAVALRDELGELARKEGVTIFLNTHYLAEAEKLCSLVGIIQSGRLLAVGTMEQVRCGAGGPRFRITGTGLTEDTIAGLRNGGLAAEIHGVDNEILISLQTGEIEDVVAYLVRAGAKIREVRKQEASLEEAFLSLVEGDESCSSISA